MLLPVPTLVPPQLPRYQRQLPPVPKLPPDTLNVVDEPEQIVLLLALAEVARIEFVRTVIVLVRQAVVLQVPSARK